MPVIGNGQLLPAAKNLIPDHTSEQPLSWRELYEAKIAHGFLREARKRGWKYTGLDVTAEPEMRPKFPELLPFTRFGKNFFSIEPEEERYDAIVLIFVFHACRYWPLYLYQASRLLRPGGIVPLNNRTEPFLRWTHGAMTENEKREPNAFEIPVLTESRRYWHTRDVNGIRLFDQIATATEIAACTGAAERLGFELLDRIEISAERPYRFMSGRRRTGPMDRRSYWGVRVGWPEIARGVQNPVVEDTLPENMFLTAMRRKTGTRRRYPVAGLLRIGSFNCVT